MRVAVSDLFTTRSVFRPNVAAMDIRITSTVLEIATKDLARALDFYRLLGLDVPHPDGPHVEVELPGGNRLAFDDEEVIAGMHPGWTPPTHQGRVAVAFAVSEPTHVDALFEKITAAGHPGALKPFDAPWGQRYATVTDPDGTSVDLFCALP
jgi:catechol 2,3-dioxygenase-like lactoylglutathione lyase family enzyme